MSAESLRELDELKVAWRALEQHLDREHQLNFARFKHERLVRVRGALRPLAIGQATQALCGGLLIAWCAPFWIAHRAELHLLASGLFGHAYGITLLVLALSDLIAISRVDYAAPVLAIQKQLVQLRARRVRWAPFHGIVACFSWIPLLLILVRQAGADVWAEHPEAVGWSFASGFVCLALLLAFMARSRRPQRAALAKTLDDGAAGQSVSRAQAMLDEIARFEAE